MMMMYSCVSHYVCKVMKTFAKDTCVGVFFLLLSLFFSSENTFSQYDFILLFRRKCMCVSAEMHIHFRRNGIPFAPNYDWLGVLNM